MSLATGFKWSHDDVTLLGFSLAGITTSIAFPAADVCFDVGQGLPWQVPIRNIAITHGHLDHAAGLPYLLGQKAMQSVPPANVYMPTALVDPMQKILGIWSAVEEHEFKFHLEGLPMGQERPLKGKYLLRPFPTYHRVPSQGYTVFQRKKRLNPKFAALSQEELVQTKRRGHRLEEHYDVPEVSFTGDTKIEVLDDPSVRASRVLVLECTYFDAKRSVAQAREWGHIHIDEILPRLDTLTCEKLVLIHSSARYRKHELEKILDDRVPPEHRDRVELFPRD